VGRYSPFLSDFLGAFNIEVTYVRSLISEETADKIPYTVYDMLQETEKETLFNRSGTISFLRIMRDKGFASGSAQFLHRTRKENLSNIKKNTS